MSGVSELPLGKKITHNALDEGENLTKIVLNGYDARIAQQNDNLKKFTDMKISGIKFFIIPTDQAFSKSQKIKVEPQDQAATNAKKETLDVLSQIAKSLAK